MTRQPGFTTLGKKGNFLGLERQISSYESSKIVVLPGPYEHTVSYGVGTGRGPRALLAASRYVEFYDEELGTELCRSAGIATLSSLPLGKSTDAKAISRIHAAVKKLIADGKFVAVLGGEHTISQAPIKAHLEKYPDLSVVQFDAHADLRDTYEGSKFSHACVMARVCEILVVHDEIDLMPGQMKIKLGGGVAGHNGLKDILAQLGSAEFWRLRIGVGHPGVKSEVVDWVRASRAPKTARPSTTA